jgi:hypothetical protein
VSWLGWVHKLHSTSKIPLGNFPLAVSPTIHQGVAGVHRKMKSKFIRSRSNTNDSIVPRLNSHLVFAFFLHGWVWVFLTAPPYAKIFPKSRKFSPPLNSFTFGWEFLNSTPYEILNFVLQGIIERFSHTIEFVRAHLCNVQSVFLDLLSVY